MENDIGKILVESCFNRKLSKDETYRIIKETQEKQERILARKYVSEMDLKDRVIHAQKIYSLKKQNYFSSVA